MEKIEDFADKRHKSWCLYCRGLLVDLATNRDHAPSQSFLQEPRPENLPMIPACIECNNGFSKDEAYMVASLSSAISGTTAPEKQIIPSARRILAKSEHLQALIQRSSSYTTIAGKSRLVWKPDIDRIQRVVVKNARGHAFYEMGEPMMNDPASVWVGALEHLKGDERDRFESGWDATGIWPEVGSRMMNRLATGSDLNQNGWVIVQENVYRYLTVQVGLMTVRTVLYNFLATEVVWEY